MKKVISIFLPLILTSLICYANSGRGRAKIVNGTLVTDRGTLLRGTTINYYQPFSQEGINSLKNLGMNSCHIYASYDTTNADVAFLDSLVNWTERDSIYLVISPGGEYDDVAYNKVINFWKFYASRYKNKTHLIFEVDNEPGYLVPQLENDFYKIINDSAPGTPMVMQLFWDNIDTKATDYWKYFFNEIDTLITLGMNVSNVTFSWHNYRCSPLELDSTLIHLKMAGYSIMTTEMPGITDLGWSPELYYDKIDFRNLRIYEKDSVSYMLGGGLLLFQESDDNYKNILEDYGISWVPDFGGWPYAIKSNTRTWKANQRIGAVWFDLGGEGNTLGNLDGVGSQLYEVRFVYELSPWIMFKKIDFGAGCNYCLLRLTGHYPGDGRTEIHLDDLNGKMIGEIPDNFTGGEYDYKTFRVDIERTEGVHAVYFKITGNSNFQWFYFGNSNQLLQAPKCSTPPAVDGVMDTVWTYCSGSPLLQYQVGLLKPSTTHADHSATFRTMWDDNYFYTFVHVVDDTICTGDNYFPYMNDGIEIFFDGGYEKSKRYDNNDIQWRWVYGIDKNSGHSISSGFRGPGDWAWLKTDLGYNFELRIPKDSITFPLTPDNMFGFELQSNDRDNNIIGRTNAMKWWSADQNSWSDAALFGNVVLKTNQVPYALPPAPVLLSPVDGAINKSEKILLCWTSSGIDSAYHVQIATSPDFVKGLEVNDSTILDPEVNISTLLNNTKYYWKVRASNILGKSDWSEKRNFTTALTGVENIDAIPKTFSLEQNYPNPFNPNTTIAFTLPIKSFVKLKVYDILGREVAILISEEMSAGSYSRQWNAANMSSGIYFYRLVANAIPSGQAGSYVETKKMILLR
jgi:hypothetical protein